MSTYENDLSRIVEELNRSVPSATTRAKSTSFDTVVTEAAKEGASDLLLIAGSAPILRIHGKLHPARSSGPLTDGQLRDMLLPLLSHAQAERLERQRSIDLSLLRLPTGRLRANLHYQRGSLAASIRLLPAEIPTLESLHLPTSLAMLAERRQGLVLLTGPTGCGKSSTMAALVERMNTRRRDHIITIEDPIEYQHTNRSSIVEQIQVGQDTPSFAEAVRAVLRQNPDVILVGEMRDRDTIAAALTAAETGHLVLSSIHTNDAAQTISRILDCFPINDQSQVRQQLSLALLAVVAQQLVPGTNGNRFPATEIMIATNAIRNLIRTGADHQIRAHITSGREEGMLTMEQSLADLVRARRITPETAVAHCYNRGEMNSLLGTSLLSPSI